MALSAEQIAGDPALFGFVRQQARALLVAYESDPRLASVFTTQQRWLLANAGLSIAFRRDNPAGRVEMTASRLFDIANRHGLASRNTADAFLKELLHYKIILYAPDRGDRRSRPIVPAESSLVMVATWIAVHLKTLDELDGGQRCARFLADQDGIMRIQPPIADGLLCAAEVRQPGRIFSLFTWLNNGGVVMDWLFAGVDPADVAKDRIPTGVLSVGDFAAFLKLSRTHLDRKLSEAERLGSLGWGGRRSHSVMWISQDFYREYVRAQAVKLAIFDSAYEEAFGSPA